MSGFRGCGAIATMVSLCLPQAVAGSKRQHSTQARSAKVMEVSSGMFVRARYPTACTEGCQACFRGSQPPSQRRDVARQLGGVRELQGEPIPSDLRLSKLVAAEFVVHPAQAGDRAGLPLVRDRAFGPQAGQGIVMRALAGTLALTAEAGVPVDHRRLLRTETQMDRDPFTLSAKHMGVPIGPCAPLVDPDREASCLSAGLTDPGTGDPFHELKPTPRFVRDGEMGEVQVSESPAGGILGDCLVRDGSPEEGELIAECASVGGLQM